MNQWRRNVLDPVMATYQDNMLPWCPDVPIAVEIYDSFGDSDDEQLDDDVPISQHEQEEFDEEEKQDMPSKSGKKSKKKVYNL